MLVVFSGLPGTGKTTISRLLAQRLEAVYLRIDTMDQPIMPVYGRDIADVSYLPEATLFDLGGLQVELEELLGVKVDLVTPLELPRQFRTRVLAEALPI